MCRGIAENLDADLALSFTGIAGPDGGSAAKPVGTVFIGLYDRRNGSTRVGRFFFPFGRERFRNASVATGFLALWQHLESAADEAISIIGVYVIFDSFVETQHAASLRKTERCLMPTMLDCDMIC
jgi:hypothetical protein